MRRTIILTGSVLVLALGVWAFLANRSSTSLANPATEAVEAETAAEVVELSGELDEINPQPTDEQAVDEAAEPEVVEPDAVVSSSSFQTPAELAAEKPPSGAAREFDTEFSLHSVSYSDVLSGGPPKDGIPAIDSPRLVSAAQAAEWLDAQEPVILVQINGDARAYPIQVLTWHEIVNDEVGGEPVTVTFCPLCNTGIAFKRTLDDQVLDFGTTGRLRFSNLIMYDRQTETWWQQATGEGIAGRHTGRQLEFVPAAMIAWEAFQEQFPDGLVLSRETGFSRPYGSNPYAGYDDVNKSPFLYLGPETPDELLAMERVLTVELDGEAVAYPFKTLKQEQVLNDIVAGQPVAVFWEAGTASALDRNEIAQGRDVGAANTFAAVLDGQALTFAIQDEQIVDLETGSTWNLLGNAVAGELAGAQLKPVVSINHFWFSWAAFKPETRVYTPSG